MYPEYMAESLRKVAETRPKRLELARKPDPVYPPMNADERKAVLEGFPGRTAVKQAVLERFPAPALPGRCGPGAPPSTGSSRPVRLWT